MGKKYHECKHEGSGGKPEARSRPRGDAFVNGFEPARARAKVANTRYGSIMK
jgi:hypothetical protein